MRTKLFVKKYLVCVIMRSTFQHSNWGQDLVGSIWQLVGISAVFNSYTSLIYFSYIIEHSKMFSQQQQQSFGR